MAKSLDDVLSAFTPEQRARVEARAQELIEEELTLRDLRHAQHLTQERLAELLGVEQENVSRIERRVRRLGAVHRESREAASRAANRSVRSVPWGRGKRHPARLQLYSRRKSGGIY